MSTFNCDKLGWVSTHEFWSRGIGSLLGIYTLTGSKQFLEIAHKCAKKVMKISPFYNSFDFINLKEEVGRNNEWLIGTSLSNIMAGFPEIIALSYLTNDKELLSNYTEVDKIISPIVSHTKFPYSYNQSISEVIKSMKYFTANEVGFFYNLVASYALRDYYELSVQISDLARKFSINDNTPMEDYYPIILISNMMDKLSESIEIKKIDNITNEAKERLIGTNHIGLKPSYDKIIRNFRYDTSGLFGLLQKAIREKDNAMINSIKESFLVPLSDLKSGNGFVGIVTTRTGHVQKGKVMPSSFFGQWLNHAALLFSKHTELIDKCIFNDRGHILICNNINPYSRNFV